MEISYDFLLQTLAMLATGGSVYGAIRSDIKHIHHSITSVQETAKHAHERLDRHIEGAIDRRALP